MGFFDSFGAGLSSIGSSLGSGLGAIGSGIGSFVSSFAGSPAGSEFLGRLGQFGLSKLSETIGLPSRSTFGPVASGSPGSGIFIPGIAGGGFNIPRGFTLPRDFQLSLPARRPALGPVQRSTDARFREVGFRELPPVPATQPFGVAPGSLPPGGFRMAAFPITREATFPGSPVSAVTNALFQPASLAGSLLRQLPGVAGGLFAGEALEAFQGPAAGTPMFALTAAGARAQRFRAQHPTTGKDVWFLPAGRPILWSGDLAACKRVKKVARRASRKR